MLDSGKRTSLCPASQRAGDKEQLPTCTYLCNTRCLIFGEHVSSFCERVNASCHAGGHFTWRPTTLVPTNKTPFRIKRSLTFSLGANPQRLSDKTPSALHILVLNLFPSKQNNTTQWQDYSQNHHTPTLFPIVTNTNISLHPTLPWKQRTIVRNGLLSWSNKSYSSRKLRPTRVRSLPLLSSAPGGFFSKTFFSMYGVPL